MSNLVTLEQAVQLCELGFNEPCWRTYIITSKNLIPKGKNGRMNKNSELCKGYYSAPTVSSALDWIREKKRIDCCVFYNNELFGDLDNAKAIYYFKYGRDGKVIYNGYNVDYKSFDTHPLAENALLDAVLEYLIEKEK